MLAGLGAGRVIRRELDRNPGQRGRSTPDSRAFSCAHDAECCMTCIGDRTKQAMVMWIDRETEALGTAYDDGK